MFRLRRNLTAVLLPSVLFLFVFLIIIGIVNAFWGSHYALIVAVLILICLLFYQVYQLVTLLALLNGTLPISTKISDKFYLWGKVFTRLSRQKYKRDLYLKHLQETLNQFKTANRAMPIGLIYLTRNNHIVWFNPIACDHFSLDENKDIGVSLTALVRNPSLLAFLQSSTIPADSLIIQSVRTKELTLSLELVFFGKDYKLLISNDITDLRRLETMRQDFIANVSHELKTPLTVVTGFVETVIDSLEGDSQQGDNRHYLQLVLQQSQRMHSLINDLLILSSLENDQQKLQEEWHCVNELMHRVYQDGQSLSSGKHQIQLQLCDSYAYELQGSAQELFSAFTNLVANAVRYTPERGHIHILWQEVHQKGIFSVKDTGTGIDKEDIPRLTERFFRVDRGRSRAKGGTGLGLAIVKHIANRHQAQLRIESILGKGSTFSLIFPIERFKRKKLIAKEMN